MHSTALGVWDIDTIDMPTYFLRLREDFRRHHGTESPPGLIMTSIGLATTYLCRHDLNLWTTDSTTDSSGPSYAISRNSRERLRGGFDVSSILCRNCMDDCQARSYRNT